MWIHLQKLRMPLVSTTSHSLREYSAGIHQEAGMVLTRKSRYASAIDNLEADELSVARSLLRTRHVEEDMSYQLLSMYREKELLDK